MRVETDGYSLTIINTAASKATVLLSDLYFTGSGSHSLAGQFPGTARRAIPDRLVINISAIKEFRDQPQYPNCNQTFPATSSAVVLVSQNQQRRLITLQVAYRPTDPEIMVQYEEYERESDSRQRMIDVAFISIYLVGFLLFIGAVLLVVRLAKKLG